MNNTITSQRIDDAVRRTEPFLIEARRHFHRYPELSRQEHETAAYIRKYLEEWDIPYDVNDVGNTVAVFGGRGGNGNRTIALRGDIDALPVQEETGCEYASCHEGIMHACGHDCHGAMMLGAAKILKELEPYIPGRVKVIFQEAEETGEGALKLMESHLLDDVNRIVGLHVTQEEDLGTFQLGYGIMSAIGRGARMTFTRGNVRDQILAATDCMDLLREQALRQFPANHRTVLVPTVIRTIPEKSVELTCNFRTLEPEDEITFEHIIEYAVTQASSNNCVNGSWVSTGRDEGVMNDKSSADLAIRVIEQTFGKAAVTIRRPYISGEDFAYYQKKIPGVMIHIGGAVNGEYLPLHTSKTMVDEKVLAIGVSFLMRYVFAYFDVDLPGV